MITWGIIELMILLTLEWFSWRCNMATSGEKIIKMVENKYKKPTTNRLLKLLDKQQWTIEQKSLQ